MYISIQYIKGNKELESKYGKRIITLALHVADPCSVPRAMFGSQCAFRSDLWAQRQSIPWILLKHLQDFLTSQPKWKEEENDPRQIFSTNFKILDAWERLEGFS